MTGYIPKLHHAMITAIVCVGFIALCSRAQGSVLLACKIGAVLFAILTATVMGLLILEQVNRRVEVMTEWMIQFSKLDEEARAAVAFTFPSMRYNMRGGVVREYFEDTNVPVEMFRVFLQTSNDRYISPKREWYTAEKPEWAWVEIHQWLQSHNMIVKDSAAGNHSWLWLGNSYKFLTAYWKPMGRVANLNSLEVVNE